MKKEGALCGFIAKRDHTKGQKKTKPARRRQKNKVGEPKSQGGRARAAGGETDGGYLTRQVADRSRSSKETRGVTRSDDKRERIWGRAGQGRGEKEKTEKMQTQVRSKGQKRGDSSGILARWGVDVWMEEAKGARRWLESRESCMVYIRILVLSLSYPVLSMLSMSSMSTRASFWLVHRPREASWWRVYMDLGYFAVEMLLASHLLPVDPEAGGYMQDAGRGS